MIGGANELEGPRERGLWGTAVCDDHSGRRRWWVLNIISGHDEHLACTRTGGIERGMDESSDWSVSQLCTNSIWQAATGKRLQDELWRGRLYFTVSGLKWGKAWKMSWSPSIKCLHALGVLPLKTMKRDTFFEGTASPHQMSEAVHDIPFILFTEHQHAAPLLKRQTAFSVCCSVLKTPLVAAVNLACRGI